jgi:hypothetical protein
MRETIQKYLDKKDKKRVNPFSRVRKPTAPPSKAMGDKSKYDRTTKHKNNIEVE